MEPIQKFLRFPLDLNMVEYIIIKNEGDFEILLDKLKTIAALKGVKYESLISKIITAKKIRRDF